MITTSEAVQNYDSSRRECYFPHERTLKFFKIYSSLNCKLECLANYTYYYCGCVSFFMPRMYLKYEIRSLIFSYISLPIHKYFVKVFKEISWL